MSQVTELSKSIKKIRGKDGSDASGDTKRLLNELVSSRQVFLDGKPFADVEQVEAYARGAFSNTNKLLLRGLSAKQSPDTVPVLISSEWQ